MVTWSGFHFHRIRIRARWNNFTNPNTTVHTLDLLWSDIHALYSTHNTFRGHYELIKGLGSGDISISLKINYDRWALKMWAWEVGFLATGLNCNSLEISPKLVSYISVQLLFSSFSHFLLLIPAYQSLRINTGPPSRSLCQIVLCALNMLPCQLPFWLRLPSLIAYLLLTVLWNKDRVICLFTITALPLHPCFWVLVDLTTTYIII